MSTSNFNDVGTYKNGSATSSSAILPMPGSILRLTSSTPREEDRSLLKNSRHTDRGWVGGIGEFIGLSSTASESERNAIEGYLAYKWGLVDNLPADHPYQNSPPVTAGSILLINDSPFDSGGAVDLANGHIEVTTGGSAFNMGSDFTISVWTKGWPNEVNASVISKGSPTTHPSIGGWMIGRGTGTNQLISNITGVGGEQSATHSKSLSTDNSWHHIVSTFDGSVRKIFLDGEQVASTTNTGSVTATNASLLFGASDFNSSIGTINAHKYAGIKIDEVRFYNTALSNLEVVELYGSGKGDKQKEGSFSTFPASITCTVGTTFSTTIDANFTNPYYSAYNLPQGLSINSATGVLSGTPEVGGSHQIIVQAESSNPEKIAVGVISYTSSAASAPILGTHEPIGLTTDSATILAEIAQSGGDVNYTVELFWGSSDGGTNASSWQNQAISMGTGNSGYFGKSITGLTAGNTYFYRLRTTQGNITSWSDDRNFTTPIPVALPSLLGQSAINITGTTVDLQVELNSTGNATTQVTFYYGTSDGGTTPSSWDSNITINSVNSGIVRGSITGGLNDGQTYYFKAQATNYKGSVWATLGDTTFTTTSNESRVTPVQNTNLKGWWKFDGNLNDTSGNNRHGQHFPEYLANLKLWLDATNLESITKSSTNKVSNWKDLSGNDIHTYQNTDSRRPTYSSSDGLLNNKPSISSSTNSGKIGLSIPTVNLQEIFVIAYYDDGTDSTFDQYNTLITGPAAYGEHRIMGDIDSASWVTSSNFNDSGSFKNGSLISSNTALPMPATLLRFTSSTPRNEDRAILYNEYSNDRGWKGGVGEIIGLSALSGISDREKIEGYLAHKWGISGSLPIGHPYKSIAPSSSYTSDSLFSNSQSLDLSNGAFATVSTGGNEDIFDAGSAFSTSFWIKGWSNTGMNILSKSNWSIATANSGTDNLSITLTGAGGSYTVQTPINNGQWNHLVTTYGGGYKKVYLNGSLINSTAQTGTVTSSNSKLTIGENNASGQSLKIDDLRIYGISLTSAEVQAIYEKGFGDIGSSKFSITSPSSILGTVGRSISFQIQKEVAYGLSGYDSTVTYELQNKPTWLSVNSSDGLVSGTPTEAGTYTFDVKASNTLGTATQTVTLTVTDYSSWNYALSFTTDCPSGTTVDNWNMLVRLSENPSNGAGNAGFRYAQANSNGGDLRFIDQAGQELKYEIASWNTFGESQVWVRVPSLTNDSNFTMLWGNSAATLPAYANDGSAWSDYFGVYHLEGGSGNAVDSSPANNVLTALNSPTLLSDGFSGKSYTISGDKGFKGSIANGPSAKEGTYIIWTKNTSGSSSTAQPFGISFDDESAHLPFSKVSSLLPNLSGNGSWRQVAVIIKDGYFSYYMDGAKVGSSTWHFPGLQTLSELALGRKTDSNGPAGSVDEASFSSVARSATWITASYNNQKTDQSSNPYLNFETLNGPVSLNDPAGTKIYGKKGSSLSFFIGKSGSGSFSANGLPNGLSINASTGEISGTPTAQASQDITITATGTTAGGSSITVTKLYKVIISDPTSFPYRMDLTLSGYTGSTTLTDFPALVSLSSSISGFSYNGFLDGDGDGVRTGGDLRFFAASGQELAYEIADWNTSGTSDIWVKVPTISGTNTEITAAWGKSGTETMPDYATNDPVWSNGYEGVWHLDTISSGKTNDSSPQGIHLTVNGGATTTAGQTGSGISLDGTDDDLEALGYKGISGGAQRSMQLWIKTTANAKAIMHWGKGDNFKRWTFRTTDSGLRLRTEITGGGRESNSAIGNNVWTHISATFPMNANNLNDIKFYVNGTQSEETSGSTSMPNTSVFDNLLIGNDNSNRRLPGIVDEVRLSSVERYADWIKAEYDNQKSSQTLISYGSVTGPRTITSPLTASGTFGSSVSYTLTATDSSSISSRVYYGLPQGLDYNDSSGQIIGIPEVAGDYEVSMMVIYANDDGDITDLDSQNDIIGNVERTSTDSIILRLSIVALSPSVTTLSSSTVGPTYASFEGNVTNTGGNPPNIIIYYGLNDGGTNVGLWDSSRNIGSHSRAFSSIFGDLIPQRTYYYRIRAFNAAAINGVWASSSQNFTTQPSTKVVASNGIVSNATGDSVRLNGRVNNFGTGKVDQSTKQPNEILGNSLKLWLDAADSSTLTLASGKVSTWSDKSGIGNHATVGDSLDRRPTYTASDSLLNNKPSVGSSSNSGDIGFTLPNMSLQEVYVVAYYDDGTDSTFDTYNTLFSGPATYGKYRVMGSKSSASLMSTSNFNDEGTYKNGSATSSSAILPMPGSILRLTSSTPREEDRSLLKNSRDTDRGWVGGIGEFIGLSSTASESERNAIEGYLAYKWGLVDNLPADHPYQPSTGANLSLHWGTTDGGTDSWQNSVTIGKKLPELILWLDSSRLTNAGTTWTDKSGIGNHATKNGSPSVVTNYQNGNSVMRYSGTGNTDYHEWDDLDKARTIFWVVRADNDNSGFMLGDDDSDIFHTSAGDSSSNFWHSSQSSGAPIRGGTTRLNGAAIDGTTTSLNGSLSSLSIVSLKTTESVEVSRFSRDRNEASRNWKGDLGELVIFNNELSETEIQKIEGYLAHKWGLTSSLPISHPYKRLASVTSPADLVSYPVDISGLTSGNTYYYRFAANNSAGTDWADSTQSFVSQRKIDLNSGTLAINTNGPTPSWSATDGSGGNGQLRTITWTDALSNTIQYKVAKFTFDSVNIGDGVSIRVAGDNPLHIDVVGDATINSVIDLNASTYAGLSVLGGGYGGTVANHGTGPIHISGTSPYNSGGSRHKGGDLTGSGLVAGEAPGGGSYGGNGGRPELNGGTDSAGTHPISGQTYGTLNLEALLAGSGGGGGSVRARRLRCGCHKNYCRWETDHWKKHLCKRWKWHCRQYQRCGQIRSRRLGRVDLFKSQ